MHDSIWFEIQGKPTVVIATDVFVDAAEVQSKALGLPEAPKRIECFDVSHIQGTDKVASMVVWEEGRMKKSDYRKFIIRDVIGNDDFASMREVVTRRFRIEGGELVITLDATTSDGEPVTRTLRWQRLA